MIIVGSAASLALIVGDAPGPPGRVSDEPLGPSIAQSSGTIVQLLERVTAAHAAAQRAAQRKLICGATTRCRIASAPRSTAATTRYAPHAPGPRNPHRSFPSDAGRLRGAQRAFRRDVCTGAVPTARLTDRVQLLAVASALVLDVMVVGAMVARIGDSE